MIFDYVGNCNEPVSQVYCYQRPAKVKDAPELSKVVLKARDKFLDVTHIWGLLISDVSEGNDLLAEQKDNVIEGGIDRDYDSGFSTGGTTAFFGYEREEKIKVETVN